MLGSAVKALTDDEIGLSRVAGVRADDDATLPQGGVLCESPETLGHPEENFEQEVVVDKTVEVIIDNLLCDIVE